jgi:hypothetical protein
MGMRQKDGTWKDSCLEKLKPGEPFFVLRAQDMLSSGLVHEWVTLARRMGCPESKVQGARNIAIAMEAWQGRKYPD